MKQYENTCMQKPKSIRITEQEFKRLTNDLELPMFQIRY